MTIYPDTQKTNLIERMLPPQNARVPQISKETGIPQDTLYGWRRQALRARGIRPTPAGGGERWSTEEKFAMVVETAAPQAKLSEANTAASAGCIPSSFKPGAGPASGPTPARQRRGRSTMPKRTSAGFRPLSASSSARKGHWPKRPRC
jgi:transposase-like protein